MTALTQTCRVTGKPFIITDEDQAFYAKMGVPVPTLCPEERMRRRLVWRNERNLYHRKCDLCKKEILSIYTPEVSHPVYCPSCFYSDKWNALNYGRDFDFNRPFFEQFADLLKVAPVLSLNLQKDNENCDYTNLTTRNKSCYLIFAANDNEDCYYCTYMHRSKNVADCFFIFDSELCYECVDCYNGYRLLWSFNCTGCSDSALLYDCRSCKNCFGCTALINKEYHLFNQSYSKEEYNKKVAEIMSSPELLAGARERFEALKSQTPRKYYSGMQNEIFSGDHLAYCKNVFDSYDCTNDQDCRYCTWLHNSKDCYDCYAWGLSGELGYENHLCGNNFYDVMFSDSCWNDVVRLRYCHFCVNGSQDLFGCIGVSKGKYCILNKQYSKEEYETLASQIMEHMKKTGEWGEFFPHWVSPFAYNETVAQEYFPMAQEQVAAAQLRWREKEQNYSYQGPELSPPRLISQTSDDILKQILTCQACKKNYKLIEQELKLYRTLNVPAPLNCFDCRYQARRLSRNPRTLWDRTCAECSTSLQTTYSPNRPERVLCEACYLKTVY